MHPLDNPIWSALNTRQTHFAESGEAARRFFPEVSVLGGLEEPTAGNYASLAKLCRSGESVALFLEGPYQAQPGWALKVGIPLLQMACKVEDKTSEEAPASVDLVELGDADSAEMIALTALTKPGPFTSRTHELGTYLGIRQGGKLVAMSGERLKIPGYTEVSAVCTHPEHLGKGYARMLMSEVMRRIRARGETPFLHSRHDNLRAVELYKRLGFRDSRHLHLAVISKD